MTVFLVSFPTYCGNDDYTVEAVFKTKESAEAYVKAQRSDLKIEEFVVNE